MSSKKPSTVCIKAAKDLVKGKCIKKTAQLVYKNTPEVKVDPKLPAASPIKCAQAKKIRVCTSAELRRMTNRDVCVCPRTTPKVEYIRLLLQLMKLGAKTALASALVYVTLDLGIWGTPNDTENILLSFCNAIPCKPWPRSVEPTPTGVPGACDEEKELMNIPVYDPCRCLDVIPIDQDRILYTASNYWNQAVTFFFEGIAFFPDNIIRFYHRMMQRPEDECVSMLGRATLACEEDD